MRVPASVIASAAASGSSRQIQAAAFSSPRSVRSLSTSSSMLRRPIATIRPRPTTTSEAATAITAIAKTWPSSCPSWRANAIRARFAPLSMISTREQDDQRAAADEHAERAGRRRASPRAPRYQVTSGPCIGLLDRLERPGWPLARARVRAEHDAADRRDEQHDRGDLEGEQVVGQEERPDRRGRAERARDLRRLARASRRSRARSRRSPRRGSRRPRAPRRPPATTGRPPRAPRACGRRGRRSRTGTSPSPRRRRRAPARPRRTRRRAAGRAPRARRGSRSARAPSRTGCGR